MPSKPELFIIETLRLEDEARGLSEGELIKDVLRRSGKECHYVYIRTRKELVAFLELFTKKDYRYLHISCHGAHGGIETTLEDIPLDEFCEILRPHLNFRRLFLSTCELTQASLANKLFKGSDLHSILGPANKIPFADAAAFWPSFYHALFRIDNAGMSGSVINATAHSLADVFDLQLNYYVSDDTTESGFSVNCIARRVGFKQFFHANTPGD